MLERYTNDVVIRAEAEYVKKTAEFRPDGDLEQRAYEFILEKHADQRRDEGSPYTDHLVAVASIVRDWMGVLDHEVVAAALLHDVVEDTPVTIEEVRDLFGERVARLVEGVTKLKQSGQTKKERDIYTRVEVVKKSGLEPEVALIKLPDRFHNMSTLGHVSLEKQQRKAEETMAVYVPLAESLGVWEVKRALEDLSAFYLFPQKMEVAKNMIDADPRFSAAFLYHWQSVLTQLMREIGVEGSVEWQAMGYWEAVKKRDQLGLTDFSRVQLTSFRVVVDSVEHARDVAAEIRNKMPELVNVGRADDYITKQTYNGYKAIHETLELDEGSVEIAIATEQQAEFNSFGVVSLMARGEKNLSKYSQKLIFDKEGKIIKFLPEVATGVDLLAEMDPWLLLCVRELVIDGKSMPISVKLSNGSMVEMVMGEMQKSVSDELFTYARLPKTIEVLNELRIESSREKSIQKGKQMMMGWFLEQGITDLEDLVFGPSQEGKMERLLAGKLKVGWTVRDLYYELGVENRSVEEAIAGIREVGLIKEKERFCKIEVQGPDEPGILRDMSVWIADLGGSVRKIYNVADGLRYETKFVISGLDEEKVGEMVRRMGEDEAKRFEVKSVVVGKTKQG